MLVPLLQISIALGILYIGLQSARYRSRIYEAVVRAISAQTAAVNTKDLANAEYKDALSRDSKLASAHHRISMWIGELPREYAEKLDSDVAESFSDATSKDGPPLLYKWFKSDLDRWAVFIISSMIPILITWEMVLQVTPYTKADFFKWTLFGHATVAAHVLIGWIMSFYFRVRCWWHVRRIVRELASIRSERQLKAFPLPPHVMGPFRTSSPPAP